MIIGFVLGNVAGKETSIIQFIRSVCLLPTPETAENIVKLGEGTPVYSDYIEKVGIKETSKYLTRAAEPLVVTDGGYYILSGGIGVEIPDGISGVIETSATQYLIRSKVGFITELVYKTGIVRLKPMEYVYLDEYIAEQLYDYEEKGLIKIYPKDTQNIII